MMATILVLARRGAGHQGVPAEGGPDDGTLLEPQAHEAGGVLVLQRAQDGKHPVADLREVAQVLAPPTAPITRESAVTTEPHTTPSTPASRLRQWVTAAVVSTAPTTVYVGSVRGSSGVSAAR